ncbi:uncharacterized protein LOC143653792 [Tamandua tetradactyla]
MSAYFLRSAWWPIPPKPQANVTSTHTTPPGRPCSSPHSNKMHPPRSLPINKFTWLECHRPEPLIVTPSYALYSPNLPMAAPNISFITVKTNISIPFPLPTNSRDVSSDPVYGVPVFSSHYACGKYACLDLRPLTCVQNCQLCNGTTIYDTTHRCEPNYTSCINITTYIFPRLLWIPVNATTWMAPQLPYILGTDSLPDLKHTKRDFGISAAIAAAIVAAVAASTVAAIALTQTSTTAETLLNVSQTAAQAVGTQENINHLMHSAVFNLQQQIDLIALDIEALYELASSACDGRYPFTKLCVTPVPVNHSMPRLSLRDWIFTAYNDSYWNQTHKLQTHILNLQNTILPKVSASIFTELINKFASFFQPSNLIFYGILLLALIIVLIIFKYICKQLSRHKQQTKLLALAALELQNPFSDAGHRQQAQVWLASVAHPQD